MNSWLGHLKNALQRKIPDDRVTLDKEYGSMKDNLKYIYPSVFKYWKRGVIAFVFIVLGTLISFPAPLIFRYFIDDVIMSKRLNLILPVLFLLVLTGGLSQILGKLQTFYTARFDQDVMLDIQRRLLDRVFSLPKIFFDRVQKGYLMSRLTGDVNGVKWFFSGTLVQIIIQFLKLLGGIVFLFYLEWRIAVPIMLSLPLPILVTKYFSAKNHIMSHHNSERSAKYFSVLHEILSSVPLIKTFAAEKRAANQITDEIKENYRLNNENLMFNSLNSALKELIPKIAGFFVIGFGAYWVIIGHWSLGSLLAFRLYLGYVYGPVSFLSQSADQLQSGRAALQRIAALFRILPEENTGSGIKAEKILGGVEFRNVNFSYEPDKPILNNISFKVKAGEHWAIAGRSGIGKTTLASLIMRFYKPVYGKIYFDNISTSDYNVRSLRQRIGYVSQSTMVLSGKIIDNIKYGNPDATYEEVIQAAKTADIHDFINSLPDKYNSFLGENGVNISEGQKQRISIARALIKNPDILIFDEPTSNLDNITEQTIYENLAECLKEKTIFIIAHRFNSLIFADKIILLRENKPPIIGTREELIRNNELYGAADNADKNILYADTV